MEATPVAAPPPRQLAVPGRDGRRAAELLRGAQAQGARVLYEVSRKAVARYLRRPGLTPGSLYDAAEKEELAQAFGATSGTSELLGRARIRMKYAYVKAQDGG